jgi:MFS family permease
MILADLAGIMATILFLKVDLPVGIAARLISGIVSGINSSVVPTYIREISPL